MSTLIKGMWSGHISNAEASWGDRGGGRTPPALLLWGGVVSSRKWQWYGQLILWWVPCQSTGKKVPVNRGKGSVSCLTMLLCQLFSLLLFHGVVAWSLLAGGLGQRWERTYCRIIYKQEWQMSCSSFGCHITVDVAPWTPIIIVVAWPWSSVDVVVVIPDGHLSMNDNGIHHCPFGCHVWSIHSELLT